MDAKDEMGQAVAREIAQTIAGKIAAGIALFIGFLIFVVLGGVVVQLLWNWLVPSIFGLRQLTLWEALGLLALSRILFGGFAHGSGSSGGSRRASREWWRKKHGCPPPNPAGAAMAAGSAGASAQAQNEPQSWTQ